MKKFYLGITLMFTGAIIIVGALIGGGLVANGMMQIIARSYDILDVAEANTFLFGGSLLFIIGLVMASIYAFKREVEQ